MADASESRLQQLRSLLRHTDGDLWADVASSEVRALLDADEDALLRALAPEVGGWPLDARCRLAYVLGESGGDAERAILLDWVEHPDPELSALARQAVIDGWKLRRARERG